MSHHLKSVNHSVQIKSSRRDVEPNHLQVDCYLTTLAGIMHKTVPEVEKLTNAYGSKMAGIQDVMQIYIKAKYNGGNVNYIKFSTRDQFKDYIFKKFELRGHHKNMKLAAGFMWQGQPWRHMVAVKVWHNPEKPKVPEYHAVDFQISYDHHQRMNEESLRLPQDYEVDYYFCFDPPIYYTAVYA